MNKTAEIFFQRIYHDLGPALLAASLTIPQAIAFAVLAGVDPEYGLALCIIPTLVALWLSRSPYLLSGPNTAVSLLLFAATMSYAVPYSAEYHGIILVITAIAAICQFLFYVLRIGKMFLALPLSVLHAIISGTGLHIILQQFGMAIGAPVNGVGLYEVVGQSLLYDKINYYAVLTTIVTVQAGLMTQTTKLQKYSILFAFAAGYAFSALCQLLFGVNETNLDLLGNLHFPSTWFAFPHMDWSDMTLWIAVLKGGFAVAVVGSLQAVVIARALAAITKLPLNVNREILAQAGMNLAAAFTASFAGAASFNRSFSNLEAGASGRLAGVIAIAWIIFVVLLGSAFLSTTPLAVVAGTLILAGLSLLLSVKWNDIRKRSDWVEFFVTYVCVIVFGLVEAIMVGAVLAFYHYILKNYTDGLQNTRETEATPVISEEMASAISGRIRHDVALRN